MVHYSHWWVQFWPLIGELRCVIRPILEYKWSILLGPTWLVMISLKTGDWIYCFIVFQILVFVAREKARHFLHCLSQISWVFTGNSLFALFSIELDKWLINMTPSCLAYVSLGKLLEWVGCMVDYLVDIWVWKRSFHIEVDHLEDLLENILRLQWPTEGK